MLYKGERNEEVLADWMRKKSKSIPKEVKTPKEIENLQLDNKMVAVFFGGSSHESYNLIEFNSKNFHEATFVYCESDECIQHFKVEKGSFILLKKFDEQRNDLSSGFTDESLTEFLNAETKPSVYEGFDDKVARLFITDDKPAVFLFRNEDEDDSKAVKKLDTIFKDAARRFKGQILAVITDIDTDLQEEVADYAKVKINNLPAVRICDPRKDPPLNYAMEEEITVENILKFVQSWRDGKLNTINRLSQPIPETQEGDVVVAVGFNFEDVTKEAKKDVLVLFCCPLEKNCQNFGPIYEELAKKLKSNKDLVIAKTNDKLNDLDDIKIKKYPTIKLWAQGNKQTPIDYEGENTFEGLAKWLQTQVTYPLEGIEKTEL